MITIVDYGRGNLWSVQNGFARVGAEAQVSGDADVVAKADAVVFPGVGAFRDCMQNLSAAGLDEALRQVIVKGRPVLAICVGMQALLAESEEFGRTAGLAVLAGTVQRFATATPPGATPLKVPHMGWNQLHIQRDCPLLKGIPEGTYTYFVHSYYAVPEDPQVVVAQTEYGTSFASVLWRDNLYATQFHPEKSQAYGLHILQNFVALSRGASG
jgi:glutamine amidotransferase